MTNNDISLCRRIVIRVGGGRFAAKRFAASPRALRATGVSLPAAVYLCNSDFLCSIFRFSISAAPRHLITWQFRVCTQNQTKTVACVSGASSRGAGPTKQSGRAAPSPPPADPCRRRAGRRGSARRRTRPRGCPGIIPSRTTLVTS
jgi:hypothetical protein